MVPKYHMLRFEGDPKKSMKFRLDDVEAFEKKHKAGFDKNGGGYPGTRYFRMMKAVESDQVPNEDQLSMDVPLHAEQKEKTIPEEDPKKEESTPVDNPPVQQYDLGKALAIHAAWISAMRHEAINLRDGAKQLAKIIEDNAL